MKPLALSVAALVFCASGGARADTAGNVRFEVPDGWQRSDGADGIILSPKDLPSGSVAAIVIIPGQKLDGDLRAWAEGKWNNVINGQKVLEGGELQVSRGKGGFDIAVAAARIQAPDGKQAWLLFVASNPGDRVEPFLYLTDSEELFKKHQDVLTTFMSSLAYDNLRAAPASRPPAKSDEATPSFTWGPTERPKGNAGLDGLYAAFLAEESFDPATYRTTVIPKWKYWTFFPDGRFYAAIPEEGLESFNFEYLGKKNPVWFGTYQLSGDEGKLVFNDDRKTTWKLVRTPKGLGINKSGPYALLDPVNGLKLEGTYKRHDWETLTYSQESMAAFITFSKDGKFEDRGTLRLAGAMWWQLDSGSFMHDDGSPGKGSYRIGHNTLELIYSDGRKRRINFHLAKDVSRDKPARIVINTWEFVLQK